MDLNWHFVFKKVYLLLNSSFSWNPLLCPLFCNAWAGIIFPNCWWFLGRFWQYGALRLQDCRRSKGLSPVWSIIPLVLHSRALSVVAGWIPQLFFCISQMYQPHLGSISSVAWVPTLQGPFIWALRYWYQPLFFVFVALVEIAVPCSYYFWVTKVLHFFLLSPDTYRTKFLY